MKILVVVDMQNDFITGVLGTPEARAIVPNVIKKVEDAVNDGIPIVFTRDTHFDDYMNTKEGEKLPIKHCVDGTYGWEIIEPLMKLHNSYTDSVVFDKFTFGMYYLPEIIEEAIVGFKSEGNLEIELVGVCTDICVVSNALLLKSKFYDNADITVDATCCAGVTPETHEAALTTMEMCQINVKR